MRLLRGVAALLACSLLLPLAAPCAASALSSSPLPCCGAPAKSGGCDRTGFEAARLGCCSTAPGEAQRLPAGIDRTTTLDLSAAVPEPAATTQPLPPKRLAVRAVLHSTQHGILRL
jgi:hypothetical protein